ncbi:STK17B [Sanghuangporus weigelae]
MIQTISFSVFLIIRQPLDVTPQSSTTIIRETELASAPSHQSADLDLEYPEIFDQSVIYVRRIGDWKEDDLQKPENRIEINRVIRSAGVFLRTLYRRLDKPRTVDTSLLDQFPDFRDAIKQDLTCFLTPTASETPDIDVTPVELRCYSDIFRNIVDGVVKFQSRKLGSTPPHTLFFGSMMIQPPFSWDQHLSLKSLEMAADCTSGLRMFVKTNDQPDIYKFALRSGLAVIDKSSSLPALICEVDSRVAQKSRTGMILQGAVSCRQWRYILPETLKEKNRLLGLFIHKDFYVDMYLFHSDNKYNVEIFQQSFFLGEENKALRLARILFNYRDMFFDVAGLSDRGKMQFLEKLASDSKVLPSFTTSKNVSSRDSRQSIEQPIHETLLETRTTPLLLSRSVESLLCPDGAYIQTTEYESVASVRTIERPSKLLGFIKLTNKHEIHTFDVIRNLGSEFLFSRVVLPTKVIEIDEFSVAFLPYGGEPLHHSWGLKDGPTGHETEIAWDLLTIISRLHDLHIAHLDIKPANILWNPSTLSIRVIDFDSSEILDPGGNGKIRGIFGTSGYAAPEVESEEGLEYDPFLADAFSCGQVLSDVVMAEKMTEEARFVLEISRELTRENVSRRWSTSKAMQVWADWLKEHGRPEHER